MTYNVKSRFLIGNNQKRLEYALLKLNSQNKRVIQVVNNSGSYSLLTLILGLFIPLSVYTILTEEK